MLVHQQNYDLMVSLKEVENAFFLNIRFKEWSLLCWLLFIYNQVNKKFQKWILYQLYDFSSITIDDKEKHW